MKANGRLDKLKAMGNSFMQMETFTKAVGTTTRATAMVFTLM